MPILVTSAWRTSSTFFRCSIAGYRNATDVLERRRLAHVIWYVLAHSWLAPLKSSCTGTRHTCEIESTNARDTTLMSCCRVTCSGHLPPRHSESPSSCECLR